MLEVTDVLKPPSINFSICAADMNDPQIMSDVEETLILT